MRLIGDVLCHAVGTDTPAGLAIDIVQCKSRRVTAAASVKITNYKSRGTSKYFFFALTAARCHSCAGEAGVNR